MTLLMTTGSLTIAAGAVIFLVKIGTVRKCRPEGKWRKRY